MGGRVKMRQTTRVRHRAFWTAFTVLLAVLVISPGLMGSPEKIDHLSPQGYVNDFAGVLDSASRQKLTALCQELDRSADAQIAVVTIRTLEGDTAQNFANRLFKKWAVGPKGKDRGVMILLAVNDRKYWTEVGYGLEPILPDGKVGGFGREMLPLLRQGQYGGALLQMASQVADVIARDRGVTLSQSARTLPPAESSKPSFPSIPPSLLEWLILIAFFGGWRLLAYLLAVMGWSRYRRGKGYRGGGWLGPMGGWSGGSGGGSWGGGGFGGFGGGSSGGGGAGGSW
jgi:uncharacterized protein